MAEDVTYAALKFGAPLEHHTKKEDVMYENFDGLHVPRVKKERGAPPKPPLEGDGQLRPPTAQCCESRIQSLHKWSLPLCLVSWLLCLTLLIGVIVLAVKYAQNSRDIERTMGTYRMMNHNLTQLLKGQKDKLASFQRELSDSRNELSATRTKLEQVVQVNMGLNHSILQWRQDVQTLKVTNQEAEKKLQQSLRALSYFNGAARDGDKIFISRDDVANWDDAVAICNRYGGQLAMPRNQTENQAVLSILKKSTRRRAFLGFNDRQTEGVFRDLNDAAITYTNWDSNQPDNFNNNEHCVQILEAGGWNDVNCADPFLVICEFISM